jgi:hypothetical protein
MSQTLEAPGFLSASGTSPPTILQDLSEDLSTFVPEAKKRRGPRKKKTKQPAALWTPAKVGDLDLDQIYRDIRAGALDYGRRGFPVIQVYGMVASPDGYLICSCEAGIQCGKKSGKHPRGVVGLFDDATSDLDTIAQWWDEHPESNVGLVGRDGIGVIIDLDRLHEGETGPDGFELWQKLEEQHGAAPETFTEDSGSLGRHLFYQVPTGRVIENSLAVISALPKASSGKIKIDVKGARGYVVGAPSLHQSGNLYRVTKDIPLAMAPDWLIGPSLSEGVRDPATRTWSPFKKKVLPGSQWALPRLIGL